MTRAAAFIAAVSATLVFGFHAAKPPLEPVAPNDNRAPAGKLADNVLTLSLEARDGSWKPDGDAGATSYDISAFAEAGKPLQVPGPLMRLKVGTEVDATDLNSR